MDIRLTADYMDYETRVWRKMVLVVLFFVALWGCFKLGYEEGGTAARDLAYSACFAAYGQDQDKNGTPDDVQKLIDSLSSN